MNMIVQELIDIAKEYDPNTEVRVNIGKWITPINKIKPCVDMDTNKSNMIIYV